MKIEYVDPKTILNVLLRKTCGLVQVYTFTRFRLRLFIYNMTFDITTNLTVRKVKNGKMCEDDALAQSLENMLRKELIKDYDTKRIQQKEKRTRQRKGDGRKSALPSGGSKI